MNRVIGLLILLFLVVSCNNEKLPKPKGFLALNFPGAEYDSLEKGCAFEFEVNKIAQIQLAKGNVPCWFNIHYPLMDATIFITYQPVNNNIDSLLMDAQRLPLQHTIKADYIEGDVYSNTSQRVHGMLYEVEGNAASQAQFYVTDSIRHFLTGSLYFNQRPNYDSIMPAAEYLKRDIQHLMETVKWRD
ncbi:MAG TPA: gliding motility lipoprotein GldD [Gillisia sp.]|nr:gliding motility lipoprotein GldD [Gillisia sp.]